MNLPDLRDGVCQLWSARTTQAHDDLLDELDPIERGRLTAYRRQEDRDRFLLGCVIVRRVVGAHLRIESTDVVLDRTCPDCARPHGKVGVVAADPPQVSVSHSGGLVLVAVHRTAAIGVDVERVDPDLDTAGLTDVVLAPEEAEELSSVPAADRARAFTTYWTRKEAVLKATGDGMRAELPGLVVSPPGRAAAVLRWQRHDAEGRIHLQDVGTVAGHVAALANLGEQRVTTASYETDLLR
jgi:4'-phosphopantetheinyl transferase